jgi:hypothetical protein
MNIAEILNDYPHCRLCTEQDNDIIVEFLRSQSMNLGLFNIRYERGPDFFSFNKALGDSSFTVMMFEKNSNDIVGIGCISKKLCFIGGEVKSYYYNSDLRVKKGLAPRFKDEWRLCHASIIEKLNEEVKEENLEGSYPKFCAILDQNQKAISSLTKKHDDLIFHPVKKYYSINILGSFLNLHKIFLSRYSVESCHKTSSDLSNFYREEGEKRYLAEVGPLFQGHNLIVRDETGKVVAITTLKAQEHRKLIVTQVTNIFKAINFLLPILGLKPILVEEPLSFLYLDNLIFKENLSCEVKRHILESILYHIFGNCLNTNYHFVSVPSFPEEELERHLKTKGFIYQKVPGTLYQMIHKKNVVNEKRYSFDLFQLPLLNLSEL